MRVRRAILALAALAFVLGAAPVRAQDTYAMPLDRSIVPGRTAVKYDTQIYTFTCQSVYNVRFEKVDPKRVLLSIKPLVAQPTPYEVTVQWGNFPAITLQTDSSGDAFILNTETGYAEK
jgi:hypothetical protein